MEQKTTHSQKIIQNFLRYLISKGVSASSLKYYKSDIANFLSWAADRKIDNKLVREYINSQRLTTPLSTLNRRLSTLRSYSNFVGQNFMSGIENVTNYQMVAKSWQEALLGRLEHKPNLKNLISKILFNRPNWYKKYHSFALANYIHIAILILFSSLSGYAVYDQVFYSTDRSLAFPSTLERPNRFLSFQGRLTDDLGNPETVSTNIVFKLYSVSSGGAALWNSGTCAITPDQDGIFSTLLGSSCGAEIASSVFSENADIWLGVTVGADAEATPRIQIATVAYSLNSETLQGFPAGTGTSTIPYIDSAGVLVLANASPKIQSTSGTFAVEGLAMTLTTPNTSNGIVTINPDGTGTLNLAFEGAAAGGSVNGFVNTTNANITSGALYGGTVASNATGYNFIDFQSGSSPTSKFSIQDDGDIVTTGDLNVNGDNITADGTLVVDGAGLTLQTTGAGTDITINAVDQVILTDFANCTALETSSGVLTCGSDADSGGSPIWSTLQNPAADLTLTMAAYNTTFNWDPTDNSAETAFNLTFDGQDTAADEDQVLMALSQVANATDSTEAADALLTFANNDANDPVENAIRFDAGGAAAADFTYGINFDAATFGTAELIFSNAETISNLVDGTVTITSPTTALTGDLTFTDDNWLGLDSSGGLIEFDDQATDEVNILNANIGVGTTAPDAKIDSLATSGEQLRLTYTDGSVYSGFTVDSNGYLIIDPTGSRTALDGSLQVGSNTTPLAYSRFGTGTTGHGGNITAANDLLISSDLELDGNLYLDGGTIANSAGTAAIVLSSSPTTIANTLSASNWLIENTANLGQAALMVNQTKAGDLFTASQSGTPLFTLGHNGEVTSKPMPFDSVLYYDGSIYTDDTTTAKTNNGSYTILATENPSNDIFYMGLDHTFNTINIDIVTAASGYTLDLEYWNGSTWTDMSPAETDNTTNLTVDGTITFNYPTDWATTSVNSVTKYWIRINGNSNNITAGPTANFTTPTSGNRFYAYGQSGDSSPALYINDFGNVGVGTSTPIAPLQVAGAPTGTTQYGFYLNSALSGTTQNLGARIIPTLNTVASSGYYGLDVRPQFSATSGGPQSTMFGTTNIPQIAAGATQNLTFVYAGYFRNDNLSTGGSVLANSYGVYVANPSNTGAITNSTGLYLESQTAGTTSNYSIYSAGGNSYLADNLGLGTTTPDTQLHIYDANIDPTSSTQYAGNLFVSSSDALAADKGGSIALGGVYSSGGSEYTFGAIKGAKENGTDASALGYLALYTRGSGATGERMRINSSGDIGIGTSAPGNQLDIVTGGAVDSGMHFGEAIDEGGYLTSTTDNTFILSGGSEFVSSAWIARSTAASLISLTSGNIQFYTDTGLTDGNSYTVTEQMRIDTSGNVGIGDASPTEATLVLGSAGAGNVYSTLATAGTTNNVVCWDNAGATLLYDCDAGPFTDYAEVYPTKSDVDYGDIVTTSTEVTTTLYSKSDKNGNIISTETRQISKLEKATKESANIIGVTSENWGDFTSTGQNSIQDLDHPLPIALSGRVPVKISQTSTNINIGDPITTSADLGRGAKATEASKIVGTALETWDPTDPKDTILVYISNGYYNPELALNSTGDATLNGDPIAGYNVSTSYGVVGKIGTFADATIAKLKTGIGIFGKVETNLISPVADSNLIVDLDPNDNDSPSKLAIKGVNDEEVASIDANGRIKSQELIVENNATISGTLYADNIESQRIEDIEELLKEVETNQSLLAQASSWNTNTATESANLDGVFETLTTNQLFVTEQIAATSLFVSDDFTTKNINSLDTLLQIQSLAAAPLEIMAGKIIVDTNGDTKFIGNVEIAGNLTVNNIIVAKNIDPIATESATIIEGEINSNSTAGTAVLAANTESIKINNIKVSQNTLVYITPITSTQNKVLFVKSKGEGYFEVGFSDTLDTDVEFNWWIIELK